MTKPHLRMSAPARALLPIILCGIQVMPGSGARAASLDVQVLDNRGAPAADAVVSVVTGAPTRAAPGTRASIDQRDRRFLPGVIAVQTGTEVSFPNSDNVRHHVYSFSKPNDFQIKLYHGKSSEPVSFEHRGVVSLGCNIHDGMVGFIAVVDTPWFATSDADGRLSIDGLPTGRHELNIWHPDAGWSETTALIESGDQRVERTLVITPDIAPPAAANPLQSLFGE